MILVSWLPPDPPNGVLVGYTVRVLIEPTGQEFDSTTVAVGREEQQDSQSVTFSGLDLANVAYRVLVTATTSAGIGPSSQPVLIGALRTATPSQGTPGSEVTTESTTDANATDATPTIGASRDDVYYVIRIVPPVVGGFLVVAALLVAAFCFVHSRAITKRKKGQYMVEQTNKPEYRYVMANSYIPSQSIGTQ